MQASAIYDLTLCLLLAFLALSLDYMPPTLRVVVGFFFVFFALGYVLLRVIRYPAVDIIDLCAFSTGLSFGVAVLIIYLSDLFYDVTWEFSRFLMVLYFLVSGAFIAFRKPDIVVRD